MSGRDARGSLGYLRVPSFTTRPATLNDSRRSTITSPVTTNYSIFIQMPFSVTPLLFKVLFNLCLLCFVSPSINASRYNPTFAGSLFIYIARTVSYTKTNIFTEVPLWGQLSLCYKLTNMENVTILAGVHIFSLIFLHVLWYRCLFNHAFFQYQTF